MDIKPFQNAHLKGSQITTFLIPKPLTLTSFNGYCGRCFYVFLKHVGTLKLSYIKLYFIIRESLVQHYFKC